MKPRDTGIVYIPHVPPEGATEGAAVGATEDPTEGAAVGATEDPTEGAAVGATEDAAVGAPVGAREARLGAKLAVGAIVSASLESGENVPPGGRVAPGAGVTAGASVKSGAMVDPAITRCVQKKSIGWVHDTPRSGQQVLLNDTYVLQASVTGQRATVTISFRFVSFRRSTDDSRSTRRRVESQPA